MRLWVSASGHYRLMKPSIGKSLSICTSMLHCLQQRTYLPNDLHFYCRTGFDLHWFSFRYKRVMYRRNGLIKLFVKVSFPALQPKRRKMTYSDANSLIVSLTRGFREPVRLISRWKLQLLPILVASISLHFSNRSYSRSVLRLLLSLRLRCLGFSLHIVSRGRIY